MKTNTELVELAATRVMGWKHRGEYNGKVTYLCKRDGWCYGGTIWSPLTSLDDAWMLVREIQKPNHLVSTIEAVKFVQAFCKLGLWQMTAAEAARAILMAALEAVGVEVKG